MRRLPVFLVLTFVLCAPLSAKPLEWRTDHAAALRQAADSKRDLFILVSKTDSATHRRLEKLWEDAELSRTINRDYVPLLVSSPDAELEPKLGVSGAPSIVIQAADKAIKARLEHPAFKQPVDVSVWLERVQSLHPGLEKRFEKLKDAEKIDDAMELANDCIELGLGVEAERALAPSAAEVQAALDKDAAKHPDAEDRDQELIEQHRDISLLLADARWMAACQRCSNTESAARVAEEIYEEHWDWLIQHFDQRLAQAALVRAYRKFKGKDSAGARSVLQSALKALPFHARAREMRFWLGLYAFWAKDYTQALAEFETVVRGGPADDVLVEAASAQAASLRQRK